MEENIRNSVFSGSIGLIGQEHEDTFQGQILYLDRGLHFGGVYSFSKLNEYTHHIC